MANFDVLELIPRAYSLPSVTDFVPGGGSRDGLTKQDVMAALAASRLSPGDSGPELLQDYALALGGLAPHNTGLVIDRIRLEIDRLILPPTHTTRCASAAAVQAYRWLVVGDKRPRDAIALELRVRAGTYRVHSQCADHFATGALNSAMAKFRRLLKKT